FSHARLTYGVVRGHLRRRAIPSAVRVATARRPRSPWTMSRSITSGEPAGEPADHAVDRAAIAGEMEAARAQLHALLDASDSAALRRTSSGTRWTNEQLQFHMVFGYLLVRTLLPLVRLVSPTGARRPRVGIAAELRDAAVPRHQLLGVGGRGAGVRSQPHGGA